jgi:UDP-glucose 4-epimerase
MSGNPKVLVTGGFGFVGSWISHHLAEDHDIYILTKGEKRDLPFKFHYLQADLTNITNLRILEAIEFDYVIHTASLNEYFLPNYPNDALDVNTRGTRNLLDALNKNELSKFIYLSTFHVYGKQDGTITEDTPCEPLSDYGITHLCAEQYVKMLCTKNNVEFITLRLTNGYGAPKTPTIDKWYLVINDFVKSAFLTSKIMIRGNPFSVRDYIWLQDVCEVIRALMSSPKKLGHTYNLSSNFVYSNINLAKKIKEAVEGFTGNIVDITCLIEGDAPSRPLKVSNEKIKADLNFDFSDHIQDEAVNILKYLAK